MSIFYLVVWLGIGPIWWKVLGEYNIKVFSLPSKAASINK